MNGNSEPEFTGEECTPRRVSEWLAGENPPQILDVREGYELEEGSLRGGGASAWPSEVGHYSILYSLHCISRTGLQKWDGATGTAGGCHRAFLGEGSCLASRGSGGWA